MDVIVPGDDMMKVDWTRIDDMALVTFAGIACIRETDRDWWLQWLRAERYEIHTVDCSKGVAFVERSLGDLFGWQEQFGYSLTGENRNLNALRDGFELPVRRDGRQILEFLRADLAWCEDRRWFAGVLAIASEHSRYHLVMGSRFLALLTVAAESPMIGAVIEELQVPFPSVRPRRNVEPGAPPNAAPPHQSA